MTDKKSVFVSMGRPFTADQTAFRDDLINFLSQNGMTPRAINVTDYPTGSPLKGIFDVMRQCSGAIIVAFERSFYPQGVDRRHSNTPSTLADTRYTTPWSQIEATMAFTLGIPILIISETGLREEGLLEEKFDWYIERADLTPDAFKSKALTGRLAAWCRSVSTSTPDPNKPRLNSQMTLKELFLMLPLKTLWQILLIGSSIFLAGASIGKIAASFPGP